MDNYFEERLEKILDNLDASDLKYSPDLDLVRKGFDFLTKQDIAELKEMETNGSDYAKFVLNTTNYVEDAEIRNMLTREFRKNKAIETKNKHVNSFFEGVKRAKNENEDAEEDIILRKEGIRNLININQKHYDSLKDIDKITFKNLELFARLWAYDEINGVPC